MTELEKEEGGARPALGQAFLSRRCGVVLPDFRAQVAFWLLLTAGLLLDLCSKSAVFDRLARRGSVSIINGFLQLVRTENAGAAFGIATGQRYLLITVSIIALIVIFGVFLFSGAEQRLVHAALGLLAAGVCGNLYDRIFNDGRVRDFIDIEMKKHFMSAVINNSSFNDKGLGSGSFGNFFTKDTLRGSENKQKALDEVNKKVEENLNDQKNFIKKINNKIKNTGFKLDVEERVTNKGTIDYSNRETGEYYVGDAMVAHDFKIVKQ